MKVTIFYQCIHNLPAVSWFYAKNERQNITEREKEAFIELAGALELMDIPALQKAIAENILVRWNYAE